MKTIKLVNSGKINGAQVLCEKMEFAPGGANLGTMRKRVRVIDAIKSAVAAGKETVELEDADFETLKTAIETEATTALCNHELLDILEAAVTPISA